LHGSFGGVQESHLSASKTLSVRPAAMDAAIRAPRAAKNIQNKTPNNIRHGMTHLPDLCCGIFFYYFFLFPFPKKKLVEVNITVCRINGPRINHFTILFPALPL
jgi:hypothetical protein